jgi:hypothetical protein
VSTSITRAGHGNKDSAGESWVPASRENRGIVGDRQGSWIGEEEEEGCGLLAATEKRSPVCGPGPWSPELVPLAFPGAPGRAATSRARSCRWVLGNVDPSSCCWPARLLRAEAQLLGRAVRWGRELVQAAALCLVPQASLPPSPSCWLVVEVEWWLSLCHFLLPPAQVPQAFQLPSRCCNLACELLALDAEIPRGLRWLRDREPECRHTHWCPCMVQEGEEEGEKGKRRGKAIPLF